LKYLTRGGTVRPVRETEFTTLTGQLLESTVRKKMATGTFTYNALRAKTLKEHIKTQGKLVSH